MAIFKEWKRESGRMVYVADDTTLADGRATGRWRAQVYLGRHPETGAARFKSKLFGKKKEAEKWEREERGKVDTGVTGPSETKDTLTAYLRDTWLPWYATQVRGIYNAEKVLAKWIFRRQPGTPHLGDRELVKLKATDFTKL